MYEEWTQNELDLDHRLTKPTNSTLQVYKYSMGQQNHTFTTYTYSILQPCSKQFKTSKKDVLIFKGKATFSNDSDGASLEIPAANAIFKGWRSFTVERAASHPTYQSTSVLEIHCKVAASTFQGLVSFLSSTFRVWFTLKTLVSRDTAKSGAICTWACARQRERVENKVTQVRVLVALKKTTSVPQDSHETHIALG